MTVSPSTSLPRRVSVIIPTHNRSQLLREALASIRAIEGPDLVFEILIGNNGTDPQTEEVAAEFGALHFKTEVKGSSASRNLGLTHATGEFLAFIDDDDVWLPESIRPQIALLDARPEIDVVFAMLKQTGPDLKNHAPPMPEKRPGEGDDLLRAMLGGYFPQMGTTVARARTREIDGLFDEVMTYGQDLDWQLRSARRRAAAFVPVVVLLFRGREATDYGKMNFHRVQYDRNNFLRNAISEWRIWRSPGEFLRAYTGSISYFYWHFNYLSELAAKTGDVRLARDSVPAAFYVFPFRALAHLVTRPDFRRALLLMFRSEKDHPKEDHAPD
ncbi:MAG: glycosyltransferase family 2 protein [Hyphomonas sp.]